MQPKNTSLNSIACEYFDYLSKNFPVMCLSDEFYFFPRAQKAADFPHILDSLDEEKIKEAISFVKDLKSSIQRPNLKDIDAALLSQSMSMFLREFGETRIWQIDPTLYLKIILIGINKERAQHIPRLLGEAKTNLKKIPAAYLDVSIEMIDAAPTGTLDLLQDFKPFLKKKSPQTEFIEDRKILESILKDSFSYHRSLEQIYEIASEEYNKTLEQLKTIAKGIAALKTWQEILSEYKLDLKDEKDLLGLYAAEIENIKAFLKEKDIISIKTHQDVRVRPTPKFMKPIRASASYASGESIFYITPDFFKDMDVHNEYKFVTAHETYPGHHLLDSTRRSLKNPIRKQIESPLFYEGWASYAETLIDEFGYIKDPVQKMFGLKRQAWRAVRAMLDVGIRIGRLKFEDAEDLLRGLGYAPRTSKFMFRHYSLSPGYQLCYTMGKFEIDRLRKKFAPKLGLKKFHDIILEGGEIPFDLVERQLQTRIGISQ